ncbi:MAG: DUF4387 family protein [Pseudomonadota bacterium]
MTKLADLASKIRSKNAGPFWLTIDIFCENRSDFERVCESAETARVAAALGIQTEDLRRFEIPDLNVLKFSCPRPEVQGTRADRDMHGASFANTLAELKLP